MPFDNSFARGELIKLLGTPRQALLLVGSGSSRFVGYPSWRRLVEQLREEVTPEAPFPDDLDLLHKASFVQRTLETFENRKDRQRQFRDYLENTFKPRENGPTHASLHRTLAQLPICGLATTNYDPVLEAALTTVRVQKGLSPCQSIDACANHRHRVFTFLRGLSTAGDVSSVLRAPVGKWASTPLRK
jgi:hypothetical protein